MDSGLAASRCPGMTSTESAVGNTTLAGRPSSLGADLHPAALGEVDRRVEDHLVTLLDAVVHLELGAEVTDHRDLSDMGDAVLDHGDLQSAAVENDRVGRHQEAGCLARDVELD